jgi:glycosyltransferase involved in cell wall biosynthesis
MGGGQRSLILYAALRALGPVDVAVLGASRDGAPASPDPKLAEAFFPDAASVTRVGCDTLAVRNRSAREKLAYNLRRFLFVSRLYAPDPRTRAALEGLLTPAHRVVAVRYALTFCLTGLAATPDRRILVDIDDRDDQKFASAAEAAWGRGLRYRLFAGRVVPAIRARLIGGLSRASHLWYATPEDVLPIPGPATGVLPNVPFALTVPDDLPPPSASREVLFVGTFSHTPNQAGMRWFLKDCWPRIAARDPGARLRIVGLGPWQSLAAEFPGLERVDYVGTVPEVGPEYARARLVISPLFEGGGSKIKVIEACAYGRPVVATPHSLRGFGADLPEVVPQAETAEAFADLCCRYLADGAAADTLGARVQAIQQAQFSRAAVEARIAADIGAMLA